MDKDMLRGFLEYLQAYYGGGTRRATPTLHPNSPPIPLFQSSEEGWEQAQPAMTEEMDLGQQMNQMFGPHDPMGMN